VQGDRVAAIALTGSGNGRLPSASCSPAVQSHTSGEQSAAISTAFVQLYRRCRGKGPTKAKTYLLEDLVLCVMEGGGLRLEETLRDRGNRRLLHEVHHALCAAVDDECRAIIERETGRRVKTVVSQRDHDCDIECKVVFLD
jgi:uncharacterized protein YbcI